jgi:hypothetical protein
MSTHGVAKENGWKPTTENGRLLADGTPPKGTAIRPSDSHWRVRWEESEHPQAYNWWGGAFPLACLS